MTEPRESHRVMIRKASTQCLLLAAWWVMLWLSFPRTNLWLLAHVSLAPLALLAIRAKAPGRAALLTYIAGVAWWAASVWWIGGVTLPGYIGLAFYMGLYPLGFVVCLRMIHDRLGYPLVFTVPIVWVAMEFLRGWILTGFPWFMLGHSQPTWVIQIADLFGAYGVSFLVAMTSGMICDVLTRPIVRPRGSSGGSGWGVPVRVSLPVWGLAMIGTLAYGAWRVGQFDGTPTQAMAVAVVQTNVPQSNKIAPTEEQDAANFDRMIEMSDLAAEADPAPSLIVWPETMAPRPLNDESMEFFATHLRPDFAERYVGYRRRLADVASRRDVSLIVGAHAMMDWRESDEGGWVPTHRYNAAYLFRPDGGMDRYDKLHRVPFGEYIPLVDSVPFIKKLAISLTPYDHDYTLRPGTKIVRFEVPVRTGVPGVPGAAAGAPSDAPGAGSAEAGAAGLETWYVAAPICFEDVVSYMPRSMVWDGDRKRVDVLVNLSNDGWFAGTAEAYQHEQIARFRCVETRTPMARSVNTGVSGFIDSCGRLIGRVTVDGKTQQVDGYASAYLHRDARVPLFVRTGDALAVTCTIVTAVLIGLIQLNKLLLGRARGSEDR